MNDEIGQYLSKQIQIRHNKICKYCPHFGVLSCVQGPVSMPNGILEVQSRSLRDNSPKYGKFESTVAHFFFSILTDCSNKARLTPIGIRHKVLALACEGMRQSVFAICVGLTLATVNCILERHAVTGTLMPGNSTGAPEKTTPRQNRAS